MKIIFFGSADESIPLLDEISKHHTILAIVSKPVPKNSKRRKFTNSKLFEYANKNNILYLHPFKLDDSFVDKIYSLEPDLSLVISYGKILIKRLIDIPTYGTINIHPSLLPKYRGPSPVQATILNQDNETGFTVIQMDEGVDTGDILYTSKKYALSWDETYLELLRFLFNESSKIINNLLSSIEGNKLLPQKQINKLATHTKLIEKKSGEIDWNNDASNIFAKYRAFIEWPKIYSVYNKKRFIIHDLIISNYKSTSPGTVEKIDGKICVHTSTEMIILNQIQFEGKKIIDASTYFNNFDLSKINLKTK